MSSENETTAQESTPSTFAVGDYVWTKFDQYPYWPSRIEALEKDKAKIRFAEDFSYKWVSMKQIKPWGKNDEGYRANPAVKNALVFMDDLSLFETRQKEVMDLEARKKSKHSKASKSKKPEEERTSEESSKKEGITSQDEASKPTRQRRASAAAAVAKLGLRTSSSKLNDIDDEEDDDDDDDESENTSSPEFGKDVQETPGEDDDDEDQIVDEDSDIEASKQKARRNRMKTKAESKLTRPQKRSSSKVDEEDLTVKRMRDAKSKAFITSSDEEEAEKPLPTDGVPHKNSDDGPSTVPLAMDISSNASKLLGSPAKVSVASVVSVDDAPASVKSPAKSSVTEDHKEEEEEKHSKNSASPKSSRKGGRNSRNDEKTIDNSDQDMEQESSSKRERRPKSKEEKVNSSSKETTSDMESFPIKDRPVADQLKELNNKLQACFPDGGEFKVSRALTLFERIRELPITSSDLVAFKASQLGQTIGKLTKFKNDPSVATASIELINALKEKLAKPSSATAQETASVPSTTDSSASASSETIGTAASTAELPPSSVKSEENVAESTSEAANTDVNSSNAEAAISIEANPTNSSEAVTTESDAPPATSESVAPSELVDEKNSEIKAAEDSSAMDTTPSAVDPSITSV